MRDKHGLLSAPIAKTLRTLTTPMVFGMVAILLFNLVDTFFISMLGTDALAAASFTFPITFALNCITMGVGVGLSTSIGHTLGQGDTRRAAQLTIHGILLALLLVTFAAQVLLLGLAPLFTLMGAEPNLLPLIHDYLVIWLIAIPLLVVPMTANSAIRATGDTKTPAMIMVIAGLINGVLDPLLIFGIGPFPQWGIQGAAIASAISWAGALIGSTWVLQRRVHLISWPHWRDILPDWRHIMSIATPAAMANLLNPLCGALLMMLLAKQGTEAVAAFGAAQRIESILLLVMMALGSALTPFMAQNLGAKQPQRALAGWFLSMRFALVFQGVIFIMMVPLSVPLSALFSDDLGVRQTLWHYLLIVPASYGCQGIMMLLVSGLNAMVEPLKAFFWSALRLFVFTLPSAWLGSKLAGIEGLFVGMALGNVIGGLLGYRYARRHEKIVLRKQEE
ncbi:MATE family efflux transporter [Vibrio sp. SM6]|uniref:Multidrug resistance protein NorM n=1 Tax=Vibrio agarilyticus TaxID=2726741 RepID=A0A7X8YHW7_9VIBR|nr:MATE family efflux transporter [Vibrio agarilyticus]NLS14005.1 MATE family efflux transporter [Vibrio agarilyticus]